MNDGDARPRSLDYASPVKNLWSGSAVFGLLVCIIMLGINVFITIFDLCMVRSFWTAPSGHHAEAGLVFFGLPLFFAQLLILSPLSMYSGSFLEKQVGQKRWLKLVTPLNFLCVVISLGCILAPYF